MGELDPVLPVSTFSFKHCLDTHLQRHPLQGEGLSDQKTQNLDQREQCQRDNSTCCRRNKMEWRAQVTWGVTTAVITNHFPVEHTACTANLVMELLGIE